VKEKSTEDYLQRVCQKLVDRIQMVVVRNLIGMTREEAKRVAVENRLKIDIIIERRSRKPRDVIIAPKHSEGAEVPVGAFITFTISKGWLIPR